MDKCYTIVHATAAAAAAVLNPDAVPEPFCSRIEW